MNKPKNKSRDKNVKLPIVSRDIAVASLIGWELADLDYGAPPLMEQLKEYLDKAVQECLEAEKIRNAYIDTEEYDVAQKIFCEKEAVALKYNELIKQAKTYFRDLSEEIDKGQLSDLRIDKESEYEIEEEFFTQTSVEWWVRKKYGRPFSVHGIEKTLPLAGIKPESNNNQKKGKNFPHKKKPYWQK